MKDKTYLIINRYQRSRAADHRTYGTLACKCGGAVKKYAKPILDNEEEEIPIKRRGPYETLKCGCPFKLKREQMTTSENWQFAQKIYNVVAKIKKNRMQGGNTVEEVLYLSAKRGYMIFYKNCEESNVLSKLGCWNMHDCRCVRPVSEAKERTCASVRSHPVSAM
ncbi:hypothetical protein M9H77_16249 [Catharanthus roseus]|uniref:Uncharacterized protein n=1 Tax=Catharanthus roseus TaxID=4058 RepID=A0ACC0B0A4_CATRO|nr:hypothetical protein M9H77_16249 [Catharanthus roseus]